MPPLSVGFTWLFILIVTSAVVQSFNDNSRSISITAGGYDLADHISLDLGERKTRAIPFAVKGIFALKSLIKGTKPVKSYSYQFRKYEKPGDANTAINDYYSIKPENSKIMNIGIELKSKPGTVLTGLAGDRRIVLLLDGDKWSKGRPVLEVIDTKTKIMPNIDRIVYKKEK